MANSHPHYFLALDVETTGLDRVNDYILEIGAVLLDPELNELARYQSVRDDVPVRQVQVDIGTPFVLEMHTKSGLIDAIAAAAPNRPSNSPPWPLRVNKAINQILDRYVGAKDWIHLLGDSVHFDRDFLRTAQMTFEKRLHHRHADCSALRLNTRVMPKEESKTRHRVMSDIEYSILTWGVYHDLMERYEVKG